MKNLALVTILSLAPLTASVPASASPLYCKQLGVPFDDGLLLVVAADGNSAVLSSDSRRGLFKRTDLRCEHLMIPQSGEGYVFLRCDEGAGNDDGYVVELRSSAFEGLISAEVSQKTKRVNQPVATLHCYYQR